MYGWWAALTAIEKDLKRQKIFDSADLAHSVQAKTVECAYNYHGIEPQNIKDRWAIVLFSLVFYVIYTVWYGYAIMYIFEGMGFDLAAHWARKRRGTLWLSLLLGSEGGPAHVLSQQVFPHRYRHRDRGPRSSLPRPEGTIFEVSGDPGRRLAAADDRPVQHRRLGR